MPHHQYDKKAIDNAKVRIAYYQGVIDKAKLIKLGDKEAIKNALETVGDMELTARTNIFTFLKAGTPQGDNFARYNCGLMEGYQDVLTLFQTPDEFIKRYEQDMEFDRKFLEEAKLYQQVESGESE